MANNLVLKNTEGKMRNTKDIQAQKVNQKWYVQENMHSQASFCAHQPNKSNDQSEMI